MVINTPEGLVVVAGCGHAGIVNTTSVVGAVGSTFTLEEGIQLGLLNR